MGSLFASRQFCLEERFLHVGEESSSSQIIGNSPDIRILDLAPEPRSILIALGDVCYSSFFVRQTFTVRYQTEKMRMASSDHCTGVQNGYP